MEVIRAKSAGFCFGVKRAVDTVYEQVEKQMGKQIYTYGPIIHNEEVVKDMEAHGVKVLRGEEELKGLEEGLVIIRSHGVPKRICDLMDEKGIEYVDATCPFVKRIHKIVAEESKKGSRIIIIGNPDHPEVEGIRGWAGENVTVIKNAEEAEKFCNALQNERVKGKLNITKYGEKLIIDNNTFGYEKILLSEVELELYANEEIYIGGKKKYSKDELITTVTTNNGKAVIEDLELGKYYIKEKSTYNNHVLDEKIYTFELKYKDQYTKEIVKDVELQNYYKKGTLEFTKTDLVSGKPIPNTLIEIYSDKELEDGTIESTLIFSGLTDENGQITIKDLFIGKGHIIEKESATGYQITEEIVEFEIKENGEIVKANLTNEQIVEVPNTMANESKLYTVISITCMVVGMGVFLYVSKKNKKK